MPEPPAQKEKSKLKSLPQYTPLRRSWKEVLVSMEKENLATHFPRMKKGVAKRDKSKYYDYHKDHAHNTEECIHLREKIEDVTI